LYDSWISSRKDGGEFIITTKKNDKKAFVIINKDGKELKTVLNTDEIKFNDPFFSPDGKQIVLRAVKTKFDELWLMDDDGGNLKQLTYYPEEDSSRNPHQYHAGPPFWEPSRNFISYISDQSGNYNIFAINPDGTGQMKISPDSIDGRWHAWSPDGNWVVFDGTLRNDNYDIFLMNYKTKKTKRLTADEKTEQAPVFVRRN
jgi:TolB protein